MKQGRYVAMAALILGAAVALLIWLSLREPRFEGAPLGLWVDRLWSSFPAEQKEARMAFQRMGPKRIPALFDMLRVLESKRSKAALWATLPPGVQQYLPGPEPSEDSLQNKISFALSAMGPPAIPTLLNGARDSSREVRIASLHAVSMMRSNADSALPSLVTLSSSTDAEVRVTAIHAIGQLGSVRTSAIPVLTSALKDVNQGPNGPVFIREAAARVLGRMGTNARAAIPELQTMLDNPEAYSKREAAIAVWRISHDTNLVERIRQELEQAQDIHSFKILLGALAEMGPAARPALPTLLRGITNFSLQSSRPVLEDLRKIDP